MNKLKFILYWIVAPISTVILTIGIFLVINVIQEKLFIPEEHLMWTFNYPESRLVFIYQMYLIFVMFYIYNKRFKHSNEEIKVNSTPNFFQRNKRIFISAFIVMNMVLLYTMLTAVTVISNNKVIDHSFLRPIGKEYSFHDIIEINTGIHGKKYLPFTHSKGDFYYIITLYDGTKIDLTEVGGVPDDEHELFIIEELDIQFVNMGISKVSNTEHFDLTTDHLDQVYTDTIRNILTNTNTK